LLLTTIFYEIFKKRAAWVCCQAIPKAS
jgi:hypothetical protein